MTLGISTPRKRMLVLGPMASGKTDSEGLAFSMHIPNIASAARKVLQQIGQDDAWEVIEPYDGAGTVTTRIFRDILHCDAAIVDISTASPNVIYELALLHSNGVPAILLSRADTDIFYLKDQNMAVVDDYSVDSLVAALSRSSEQVQDPRRGQIGKILLSPRISDRSNPITDHFKGVHLVNVASATGLATGQWYNFLSYVLDRAGIFSDRDKRHLKGIILIRPDRVNEAAQAQRAIEDAFEIPKLDKDGNPKLDRDGNPELHIPEYVRSEPAHIRGKIFVKHVGNWLIDYPTPILSLAVSKQYEEIMEYIRDRPGGDGVVVPDDLALEPFESALIDVYFQTLRNLAHSPMNKTDWKWVKVMPLNEAIEFLKAEQESA